jgi:hypothetical protein
LRANAARTKVEIATLIRRHGRDSIRRVWKREVRHISRAINANDISGIGSV